MGTRENIQEAIDAAAPGLKNILEDKRARKSLLIMAGMIVVCFVFSLFLGFWAALVLSLLFLWIVRSIAYDPNAPVWVLKKPRKAPLGIDVDRVCKIRRLKQFGRFALLVALIGAFILLILL